MAGVDPEDAIADGAVGVDDESGSQPQPSQGKRLKPADDVVSLGDLIAEIQDVFGDASQNWKKHESEIMSALVVVDHVSSSIRHSSDPQQPSHRSFLGNGHPLILPRKITSID